MADEETEIANVKKIGVLSLAVNFALISLFSSIIFSLIVYFVFPLVTGLLPFVIPFQISLNYILIFCAGSTVITFILFLILGLFYNLSAKITKGIKLYS